MAWQQPRHASGWAPTLRRWGAALGKVAPAAIGLAVPNPVVMAMAGTALVGGTIGVAGTLRSNPWVGFEADAGERYDPDADELPVPGLLDAFGWGGLEVDGVLFGGEPGQEWFAFQSVDRLGGRTTRLATRLPGRARHPVTMVARSAWKRSDSALMFNDLLFGDYLPARGHRLKDPRRLATLEMKRALNVAQVQRFAIRGRWLVADLYPVTRIQLRPSLTQGAAWLLNLRDAYPRSLLDQDAPAPASNPDDEAEWQVMHEGRPVTEAYPPSFTPKPSRRARRSGWRSGAP